MTKKTGMKTKKIFVQLLQVNCFLIFLTFCLEKPFNGAACSIFEERVYIRFRFEMQTYCIVWEMCLLVIDIHEIFFLVRKKLYSI